jgi:hypothetical protein
VRDFEFISSELGNNIQHVEEDAILYSMLGSRRIPVGEFNYFILILNKFYYSKLLFSLLTSYIFLKFSLSASRILI